MISATFPLKTEKMKVLLRAFSFLVLRHTHTCSEVMEERGFPRDCCFSNRRHLQLFQLIRPPLFPLFPLFQLSTITEGGIQVKLCEITVTVHANSPQPTHNGTCHSEGLPPSFCIRLSIYLIKMYLSPGAVVILKQICSRLLGSSLCLINCSLWVFLLLSFFFLHVFVSSLLISAWISLNLCSLSLFF